MKVLIIIFRNFWCFISIFFSFIQYGFFKSIYFFDPNGHRIELAANTCTDEQMKSLNEVAEEMLEEWSQTKRAPRHAAWLHEMAAEEVKL